ncbi:hypothetical protein V6N13_106334 [Hibiscus sabdariffa]
MELLSMDNSNVTGCIRECMWKQKVGSLSFSAAVSMLLSSHTAALGISQDPSSLLHWEPPVLVQELSLRRTCVRAGRFTDLPTAEKRGPRISGPIVGAPNMPRPAGAGECLVGCLADFTDKPLAAAPFNCRNW